MRRRIPPRALSTRRPSLVKTLRTAAPAKEGRHSQPPPWKTQRTTTTTQPPSRRRHAPHDRIATASASTCCSAMYVGRGDTFAEAGSVSGSCTYRPVHHVETPPPRLHAKISPINPSHHHAPRTSNTHQETPPEQRTKTRRTNTHHTLQCKFLTATNLYK